LSDRILVIGGTGVFGSRLSAALARLPGVEVIVAGRDLSAATALAHRIQARAARIDRSDPGPVIEAERPFLVIDAAGPFQPDSQGYPVARAALRCGAHYLDLSDDAAFTAGITALDSFARDRGLVCLSGVSSVPALSAAAVQDLSAGLTDLHLIDSVILPGNRAPRGLAVVQAILAQAGHPVPFWRAGRPDPVPGWSRPRRIDIGQGPRWASPIGAPDLTLFPSAFQARSVRFRAGLELSVMHLGLWALSFAPRLGLVRSLVPLARPLRWMADRLYPFGTDRGGMRVTVIGTTPTGAEERSWTLTAEAGDGPEIPTLPARAAVAALCNGKLAPGARPCLDLPLAAIEAEMTPYRITTRQDTRPFPPLFSRAVDLTSLPPALCDLHTVLDRRIWTGQAEVQRGRGILSRLVAGLMRFPPASADTPVTVTMDRQGETELWTRQFAARRFRSRLSPPADGNGLIERFGPLSFRIALAADATGLAYPVTQGWCLGLPIPRWLLPVSTTRETVDDQGRACFDVALSHPLTGLIVRYRGWLVEDQSRK
jgi:hypothetical protein